MRIVFDACAVINLSKGDGLVHALGLADTTFGIGPQALRECAGRISELEQAISSERVLILDDMGLPAETFVRLSLKHRLGDGETECLAFAIHFTELIVCTDDGAARRVAEELLGKERVIGSLFLLRACVREGLISTSLACSIYHEMLSRGAFLPDISCSYFS